MRLLKRIFTGMLILLVVNLYLPNIAFAEPRYLYAKAGVTEHEPEILSTPEEKIPTVKVKKTSGWTWLILIALIGGAAAAAGGGGDEESSTSSTGGGGSDDTGSYAGTW